jgi:hypothetical protein
MCDDLVLIVCIINDEHEIVASAFMLWSTSSMMIRSTTPGEFSLHARQRRWHNFVTNHAGRNFVTNPTGQILQACHRHTFLTNNAVVSIEDAGQGLGVGQVLNGAGQILLVRWYTTIGCIQST